MIKILNIVKYKKGYEITLLNDEKIMTTEKFIIDNQIYINKEFEDEVFNEMLEHLDFYKYLDIAIKYVDKYYRCSFKIKEYLRLKGANKQVQEEVVSYLETHHLIDDERYLCDLINYYIDKSYGPNYIMNKIKSLRFSSDLVNNINLDDYYTKFYEKSTSLINKLNSTIKEENQDIKRNKIIKHLLNRGFLYDMIQELMKEIRI